jgi:hypothetical protein
MPLKKALSININIYGLIVHLITTNFIKQANFSLPIAYNKILQMFVITCLLKFRKTKQKSEAQLS